MTDLVEEELGNWQKLRRKAKQLVTSQSSNAFFALVVLTNSLYLGIQLEYHAVVRDSAADSAFLVIHLVYATLFTAEVALRLLGEGWCAYFCSGEWAWNLGPEETIPLSNHFSKTR